MFHNHVYEVLIQFLKDRVAECDNHPPPLLVHSNDSDFSLSLPLLSHLINGAVYEMELEISQQLFEINQVEKNLAV